ncbi:hypothetical protein Tco_1044535 [Tanacetum coccineum]|uniref:Uncharacterized protein n=1 Tax=Tanacetum coccineum TaxID=301880 RepID=A0ABQ5GQ75_9ASTR
MTKHQKLHFPKPDSHATTRSKAKEMPNQFKPPSESAYYEEDCDPVTKLGRIKEPLKKKFWLYSCKVTSRNSTQTYTNNNSGTSSNTETECGLYSKVIRFDNQTGQFGNQRAVNVVGARETVGGPVVQQSGDTVLEIDDKLFNHDAYWQRIGMPTSTNRRTSLIKEPLMRVVHRLIIESLVHRLGSKERYQKRYLWMMSALEESRGINLAWVIAGHLCKHDLGLKENSLICGGHYVTEIAKSLGYFVDEEVAKCSEPIECEKWTSKMLVSELDEENCTLFWGNWNASLNDIERGNVWRDLMLMRNNYMLEHSMPILHHLADQANFAYPTYEPPNVLPYPYPYVPYPHPYTHYPDPGNQSFRGEHYGAHGNDYFAGSIVPSSSYEIRGSSGGVHGDDDDESDQFVRLENCMASKDDDDMED